MPRFACPNCESEDLKSSDLSTVEVGGRTVIVCSYCTEGTSIVAGENGPRFAPSNVIGLLQDIDGYYDDGIEAFVSVAASGDTAEVELTTCEPDEAHRVTQRFRVTAERIEEAP